MRVLGIDTATAVATAGVVSGGAVLADVAEVSGTPASECLVELATRALDAARLPIDGIDAIAVSVGPGSFTGLRVGLSFAKGIAFSNRSRLVGIPTLEALAWLAPSGHATIAAALDARRGEVYLAIFRRHAAGVERVSADLAVAPEEAVARIAAATSAEETCALVGNAAERYPMPFERLRGRAVHLFPFREIHPRGSVVAALGERRLGVGEAADIEAIVPSYLRACAAERNLDRLTLTRDESVA
jgi:tRNA threonylcarbamoyladenosine biosynthesis protein TsaB